MLIQVSPGVPVLPMDVHKATISAGLLAADAAMPVVDKISSDDESVQRQLARATGSRPIGVTQPVWRCCSGPAAVGRARPDGG